MSISVSTPGRICLFGEHQDYLGLPVIAAAISRRVSITGQHQDEPSISVQLPDIQSQLNLPLLEQYEYTEKRDYFKSALNQLLRRGLSFSKGIDCVVKGNIPINSGTSSSSALLVTWIHFLLRMSDQAATLTRQEIGELSYAAEVLEFGEPGGMMDQYSTAVGDVIYLASVPSVKIEFLKPRFGAFVLGDSQEPKDTIGILGRLRYGVLGLVEKIQQQDPNFSLQHTPIDSLTMYNDLLSEDDRILLRGTLSNRDILLEAKQVLESEPLNHVHFGSLLTKHHHNLRDAQRISTPKIERMIDAALQNGALGAKINGSGGGGCMFAYAPENPEKVAEAIEAAGGKSYIISIDEGTRLDEKPIF